MVSKELARKLRHGAPEPERAMWRILYSLRRQGYHFRRQVQLGSYLVDFACLHAGLAIEVDGDTHSSSVQQSNDAVRDDYLSGRGYRVLRFWNNDVMDNPEGVFSVVSAALADRSAAAAPPTPDPSPQGGGRHWHLGNTD